MSELDLWNEMGNMYYFAGAYDEAIRTYTKVIRLDPGYAQSYSNLASILVTQGRHAEALPVFRKAIELTNEKISRAFLWKQLGDVYRELNDHSLASDAYRNAIQLLPEDASLQESLAEIDLASQVHPSEPMPDSYHADNSPIEAEPVDAGSLDLEAPIREEPEPLETEAQAIPEVAPEISSSLPDRSLDGEHGNACWMFIDKETAAQPAQENPPEQPEPSPVILGGRLLGEAPADNTPGEIPENLDHLEAPAPEQALDQVSPAEILGLDCGSLVEGHSAIDQPESGIFGNVSPQALLRLGILHWRAEEYERAFRFLEYALVAACRARDRFLQALCHHATARLQTDMGKIEAAIHSYQSAANLAPERIFPWNDVANLTCRLGRYEDARVGYQEAIEHNSKDPIAWNGLGDVYHKLGRFEDAIAAYQLGNVFEGQAIDEDVLKTFERSIDSDQENPLVWNEAGDIYFRLDAFADAIASYRKAVQLDPANPTFQVNLARARQIMEELNGKNEPSDSGILKETDQDTQPLPKNFLDEMVSPKPEETIVIVTHPGTQLRVEPFILKTDAPQPAETNRIRAVSRTSQPIQSDGVVLEQAPDQSKPPAQSGPETPCWMVKDVQPSGNPAPSNTCYLPAITETLVRTDIPIPSIEVRTPYKPAFSGAQVLTEADQDHINVLVQMTPRPPKPSWSDEVINTPAVDHTWGKASLDEDAISRRTSLADSQSDVPARQFVKPACKPAEPVPQTLHPKESDIAACLRVTEINPMNDRAWDALGSKYETAGLYSEAISAYEQAIVLSPQKEVYYYHLGIALAYQMHYDKAIQALEKVLALNPKYTLAHCALAGYYRKLGRETDAKIHVAIARPSMETENEYNQACFESISGDADRALELLELAFEKKQVQSGMIQNDPDLDFIRTDPRFATLLARNGIFDQ